MYCRRSLILCGLLVSAVAVAPSQAEPVAKVKWPEFRHEFTSATMSDGVKVALAVGYPRGWEAAGKRQWPAIFSMCGYTSACHPMDPAQFGHRYVTVNVSVRGTGASGGTFNPWGPRSWQDGYEVIENWIVKQPWSNGKAGIVGHSWPGLMGFLVAATNPPSLRAVCVSGLIEDFYRGICRVGGIRNCGFPVDWLNSYYDPNGPFGSDAEAKMLRGLSDAAFREILAARPPRELSDDVLWISLQQEFDGPLWRERSLCTYASRIRAPVLIGQTYQDEQTGPNGWWLWRCLPDDVPKRLILTNGGHGGLAAAQGNVRDWFDQWLLDEKDAAIAPTAPVRCYFESVYHPAEKRISMNAPLAAADFPLPETRWTRRYLRSGPALAAAPPPGHEPPDMYQVGHGDPSDRAQKVDYVLDFEESTAICGPMVLTLWAQLSTLDADFFVVLADMDPQGRLFGLQRGLLRASHREIDQQRSDYVAADGQRLLIRPHHPHARAVPITPRRPYEFQIEVFAVGHVFRPGHKLVLRLSGTPSGDPIGATRSGNPSYRYDSRQPPAVVSVLHDAEHPSSLLVPILPKLPPVGDEPPATATLSGIQALRP